MSKLFKFLMKHHFKIASPFRATRQYVKPARGDLTSDFDKISGDMRTVTGDFKKIAKRELTNSGEQSHASV